MIPPRRPAARAATLERLAFVGLGALLVALAAKAYRFAGNDFRVFRTAGERFVTGAQLYPASDGFYAYRYAPGAAALFAPLAAVSQQLGKALWMASIVVSLLAACVLLQRRLRVACWFAAPLAVFAATRLVVDELQNVQVNALTLALVVAAFALEDDGRALAAGALLSMAIALKVAPVIVALDWVVRRRVRPLAGVALGLGAIALLPSLTYGLGGDVAEHLGWLRSELRWSGGILTLPRNQSLWSLVLRLDGTRLAGGVAALAVVVGAFTTRDRDLRRGLVVLAIPLASAYGWLQNFLFAIPLTALLLARHRRIGWVAFALAASTAIFSYDLVGRRWEAWGLEHTAVGLSMLALFLVGRASAWTPRAAVVADASAAGAA